MSAINVSVSLPLPMTNDGMVVGVPKIEAAFTP